MLIDEISKNIVQGRPGAHAAVIWTSEGFPVDNDGSADTSGRKVGTTLDNGTVFRVVSFGPGVTPRNHRTDSIDYATVISGEIDMELDGTSVRLKAGDVLVQRGTIHNWVNKGTAPCVIAFVLVAAKPVTVGGKVLNVRRAGCPHYPKAPPCWRRLPKRILSPGRRVLSIPFSTRRRLERPHGWRLRLAPCARSRSGAARRRPPAAWADSFVRGFANSP